MTDRIGQQIGNYQLIKLLGEGGCAKVYLGQHRYLDSYAALKVLNATLHAGDEPKFLTEAQALVDLRHAHIVHLLDFVVENGTPALIMDYARKGSLRHYCPDGTRMPLTTVADFVAQIASALQYAHEHHVIHCDVKPENVLLDADNRLLLSDFGLSLLTPSSQQLSTQDPAGTARYMAPEQLRGKPCFASDQYALAVMVYEWLCGRPPFRGNMWEVSHQHMHTDPPPLRTIRPDLPPMVGSVMRKALAKRPEDRFASVQMFAQALAFVGQTSTTSVDEIDSPVTTPPQARSSSFLITPPHHALPVENDPVTQIPGKGHTKVTSELPPASTLQHQNRMRLLQRVRSFWINGVLEQSLHGAALLSLGLQVQPDAVANPWQLVIQDLEHISTPLPAGSRIIEVYDEASGELLILGEPGSGKTTLLLELARDLLLRAEQRQTHPIPVVFNLSSWMRKRQSLADWLIEELETKYQVPRTVGASWVNANQILPLLDGLDEVDPAYRTACVQMINEYHQAHSIVPLVVCCRMREYMAEANQLALYRAVSIQPLANEQINEYLACIGGRVESLRIAFQRDSVLQELATTPLMLTILILVYQDASLEEIKGGVSAEVRRQQIFETYTQRMLKRRSPQSRYRSQQTIHWLSYLAQQMQQQCQTVFYIERMQPGWLQQKWQRRLYYGLIAGPLCGLFIGLASLGTVLSFPLTVLIAALIIGLLFGWLSEPGSENKCTKAITRIWVRIRQRLATSLESKVVIGGFFGSFVGMCGVLYMFVGDFSYWPLGSRIFGALSGGLPIGMCFGVCVGLAVRLERRIEPVEGSGWSWRGLLRDSSRWLLIGTVLIVGLNLALPFMILSHDEWLGYFLAFGLSSALELVVVIMLVSGVTQGLSKRLLDTRHILRPNQGIWRSVRYGAIMAIITGVVAGSFSVASDFTSYYWLPLHLGLKIKKLLGEDLTAVSTMSSLLGIVPTSQQMFWMLHALFWGMTNAVIPAWAVGLSCGGAAYVQHFVLRFLLWCRRSVPFNYSRFLDYAAERILLRKVGGGYIFIHRSLLEYFADLEIDEDVAHYLD